MLNVTNLTNLVVGLRNEYNFYSMGFRAMENGDEWSEINASLITLYCSGISPKVLLEFLKLKIMILITEHDLLSSTLRNRSLEQ